MNRQDRRKAAAHRRYLNTMIAEGGGKPHDASTKFVVQQRRRQQRRLECGTCRQYLDTMIAEGGGKPHDARTKFAVELQIITKAGLLNALRDTRASAAEKDHILQIVEWLESQRQQGRLECGTCDRKLAFADFDDVLIIGPYNDHSTTAMFAPLCRACAARPRSELTVAAAQAALGKDINVLEPELPVFPRSGRA